MSDPAAPDPRDDHYVIARLVMGVAEQSRRRFEEAAAAFELTSAQARMLLTMAEPRPMSALAEHLACDASYVTGLTTKLERRGLVSRTAGDDRRVRMLALTPAGRRMRDRLRRRVVETSPAVTRLSEAERDQLRSLLAKLAEG